MTMRLLLSFMGIVCFTIAYAQQTITAKIVDKITGLPISETNIRFEGASSGTISDDKGRFTLSVKETESSSNLIISHIGYQTKRLPISEVTSEMSLEEQVYQIGEIAVKYLDLRKLLLRKWKVEDSSINKLAERALENAKKKDPKKYEKLAKKPETMKEAIKVIRLVFDEDGTGKVKALLFFGQSFMWQLDEDSREIVLIDKEGNEQKRVISELNEKHLVLKFNSKDGTSYEIGYIPVN